MTSFHAHQQIVIGNRAMEITELQYEYTRALWSISSSYIRGGGGGVNRMRPTRNCLLQWPRA